MIDQQKIRVLAVWGTGASEKFLKRIKSYLEPSFQVEVKSAHELTNYKDYSLSRWRFNRFVLRAISHLITIVGIGIFFLSGIAGTRSKDSTEILSPIAAWYLWVAKHKLQISEGRPTNFAVRRIALLTARGFDPFFDQAQGLKWIQTQEDFDILLIPGENILLGSPVMIRQARLLKLPVVVYDFTTDAEKGWTNYFSNPNTRGDKVENFVAINGWPKYSKVIRGKRFGLPIFAQTLAELTGLSPEHPWSVCGGFADGYLAPTEKVLDFYINRCGISEEKVQRITAVEISMIQRIREIQSEISAIQDTGTKNLLILLPPNQFTAGNKGIDSIFSDWASIVDSMVSIATELGDVNVVAALHPRAEDEHHALQARYPEVEFSVEDVVPLLANADLIFSSTSGLDELAATLKIPTVIWNVYGYELGRDFYDEKTLIGVPNRSNPLAALQECLKMATLPNSTGSPKYPDVKLALETIHSETHRK